MRIVLDTNVLISSFISRGLCAEIFEMCIENYTIILSEYIVNELTDILEKKFKIPSGNIKNISQYLNEFCEIKTYNKLKERVSRDKNDDEVLALAVDNSADFIITGDKDLLVLKEFNSIPIITSRQFWDIIRASHP